MKLDQVLIKILRLVILEERKFLDGFLNLLSNRNQCQIKKLFENDD